MPDRTPYQRGNRDALLQFAHVAAARAEAHRAEVDRCSAVLADPVNAVQANAARVLQPSAVWRMQAWLDVAALAERMAEARPEDPESTEEAP
jgi:Lon protease-like protein